MTIYAWTPCSDGTIKKIDATSIVTSVDTGCTETWIASANRLALVPGRRGEVVSMNGLGTIKDRRTLQHRIAIAVGVVNDVYCFDGRGKGTIVTLDNNGLITVGEKFICPGIVDPMNAIVDGTTIYIACRSEDVYSFETTTQVTTRISRNHDDVLTSVVDNNTITKLHNNTIYARLFGGAVIGGTDYFVGNGAIHTTTSRVIDSRIRADGICAQVGSDGTQFIKSCPSRKSIQWISGSIFGTEVFLNSECKCITFSTNMHYSNEDNAIIGSGVPGDDVLSPLPFELSYGFRFIYPYQPDYPGNPGWHPDSFTVGPYPYSVTIVSGLLLTTFLQSGFDDYLALNDTVIYDIPATNPFPLGYSLITLPANATVLFRCWNEFDGGTVGNLYLTLYPT